MINIELKQKLSKIETKLDTISAKVDKFILMSTVNKRDIKWIRGAGKLTLILIIPAIIGIISVLANVVIS